ncbi:MAG: TonB-dependent receptor plug domain-containing protein, partial [Flavitalea sp.]
MKIQLLMGACQQYKARLCTLILPLLCCFTALATDNDAPGKPGDRIVKRIEHPLNPADTTVKGRVTGQDGNPIGGVSVLEKGTSNGTTTDSIGNYTLNVKDASATLVVSNVGFTPREIAIGSGSTSIILESVSASLDDVVVVGYGTQKRSELTNAVVQTTGAELKKSNTLSLSNSLSGRLAGLFVTQTSAAPGFDDAQILVRGPKTFRNSSALIVIDGVANADPDGLNRLDPNEIESISVLKDASAAIYGAQSAGGVILVTTKRGKSGKPSFDFSTTLSWQAPTMKIRSADAFEYMKVLNDRRALENQTPDFPETLIQAFRDGTRRPEDWYNALVDPPAKQQRYSLTMRGGSERVRYFVSLGAANQGGILRGDDKTSLKQYNVRSNIDVTVTKSLEVGV